MSTFQVPRFDLNVHRTGGVPLPPGFLQALQDNAAIVRQNQLLDNEYKLQQQLRNAEAFNRLAASLGQGFDRGMSIAQEMAIVKRREQEYERERQHEIGMRGQKEAFDLGQDDLRFKRELEVLDRGQAFDLERDDLRLQREMGLLEQKQAFEFEQQQREWLDTQLEPLTDPASLRRVDRVLDRYQQVSADKKLTQEEKRSILGSMEREIAALRAQRRPKTTKTPQEVAHQRSVDIGGGVRLYVNPDESAMQLRDPEAKKADKAAAIDVADAVKIQRDVGERLLMMEEQELDAEMSRFEGVTTVAQLRERLIEESVREVTGILRMGSTPTAPPGPAGMGPPQSPAPSLPIRGPVSQLPQGTILRGGYLDTPPGAPQVGQPPSLASSDPTASAPAFMPPTQPTADPPGLPPLRPDGSYDIDQLQVGKEYMLGNKVVAVWDGKNFIAPDQP